MDWWDVSPNGGVHSSTCVSMLVNGFFSNLISIEICIVHLLFKFWREKRLNICTTSMNCEISLSIQLLNIICGLSKKLLGFTF